MEDIRTGLVPDLVYLDDIDYLYHEYFVFDKEECLFLNLISIVYPERDRYIVLKRLE